MTTLIEPYVFKTAIRLIGMLLVAHLTYKLAKWLYNYIYRIRVMNKMKGLPMLPFIGSAHLMKPRTELYGQLRDWAIEYKDEPVFLVWLGTKSFTVFHKADHLDIVFSSQKHSKKSLVYNFTHPWLGTGLLNSYGLKWQERRRMITPAFHFDILNDFIPIMNEQAEILVDILTKFAVDKQDFNIFPYICSCSLDIICETAMGQNVNAQSDSDSKYVNAVISMSQLVITRVFNPLYWNDFIYSLTPDGRNHKKYLNTLHSFTRKVIIEREEELKANYFNFATSGKRMAFLDVLLKAKHEDPTITLDDVQEEVDTFMFEGHDTTACAVSWTCHMIGSHPEVQRKLHAEIDSVMGDLSRPLNKDDLHKLNYLECVIKETLRLFPSVPMIGREITKNDQVDKYQLVEGEAATILIYMVHRDEKYFPDPEKFDPNRFLIENTKDRHPYAYIPFSAGRRNCVGQKFAQYEEKILLANLLRKFEIKSLKTTEEIHPLIDLITRPKNAIQIQLKLRA